MANPDSGVSTPPRREDGRIDWKTIVDQAKATPGEWIEVGDGILTAVATYVKRRYGLDTRMKGQDPATARGRLKVRWPEEGS